MSNSINSSSGYVSWHKGLLAGFSVFMVILGIILTAFYDTVSKRIDYLESNVVTKREFDLLETQYSKVFDVKLSKLETIETKITRLISDPSIRFGGLSFEESKELRGSIQGILKYLVAVEGRLETIDSSVGQMKMKLNRLGADNES